MCTLEIRLLGDFQLFYDSAPLARINTARLQSLLAYLLLHRGVPQSRQYLSFLFWPDSSEVQARTNLRNLFHALRHSLPEGDRFLRAGALTIEWLADAPYTLDVASFEAALDRARDAAGRRDDLAERLALDTAVGMYAGDLLPACFGDWIVPERERLRSSFLTVLDRLSRLLEQHGDYQAAIRYAQRRLQYDPLHEEAYRHLLRLHALNGDRVALLRTYNTCAAVLRRELEVEPSAPTRELYDRLLKELSLAVPSVPAAAQPISQDTTRPLHNLPSALTSFVGRQAQLAQAKDLFAHTRLLTLTGPAGAGKTRLALELARYMLAGQGFADGVCWVELALLANGALLPSAVLALLRIPDEPGHAPLAVLSEAVRDKQLLLVLDNCEHLVQPCAKFTRTLLSAAPRLKVLATSREVLSVIGETTQLVPPLECPPSAPELDRDSADIGRYESVRLFAERAASVLPTFRLTAQNAWSVAEICRRLDGIPLAIELAAARVKILSVAQIAARLDDMFHLLRSGSRAAAAHHQTLHAALDWSYELLTEAERLLFCRLSVFAGGFTIEAAEQVTGDEQLPLADVLDLLSRLVDKSLVVAESRELEARYSMLEIIRQYAREHLVSRTEHERIRHRHARFFTELAEAAQVQLSGPEQVAWLQRLSQEHGNLREAMSWTAAQQETELSLRLTGALVNFWWTHGHYAEGVARLTESLALPWTSAHRLARARALGSALLLLWRSGDYAAARACGQECLCIERELGDQRRIASALSHLANVVGSQGDEEAARRLQDESLALRRELGDQHGLAISLNNLGEMARARGDLPSALSLYEEALSLYRATGNRGGTALVLHNMAHAILPQGQTQHATSLFIESLTLYQAIDGREGIAMCLAGLAAVCAVKEIPGAAARLFGASEAIYAEIGAQMDPADRQARDRYVALLRAHVPETALESAWTEGRAMTQVQAEEYARESSREAASADSW